MTQTNFGREKEREREAERERERERPTLEILGELQKFGFDQARESSWFSGTKLSKICNCKTSWDTVSVFDLVHLGSESRILLLFF